MPPFLGKISYENKLQIIGIFLKGHNSVKNCSIIPKIKLDLIMINLYNKFHFNMCTSAKEMNGMVSGPTDRQTDNSKEIFKKILKVGLLLYKCIQNDKKISSYVDFIISYVQN